MSATKKKAKTKPVVAKKTGAKKPITKKAIGADWFPKSINPKKPGVYRTSRADCVSYGHAYNRWTGKTWERHGMWGNYSGAGNLVWEGTGKSRCDPFTDIPER